MVGRSIATRSQYAVLTAEGGRYDGILGVQAGLEVLRNLHEHKIETHCPISLIDWTNEEGARFPGAMMSSGVWSTKSSTDLQGCYKISDTDGMDMRAALEEIGYLGPTPCDYRENGLEAYFELHIEQGPKLERAGKTVGVVTAVQGMKWFAVRVTGVEGHSGKCVSYSSHALRVLILQVPRRWTHDRMHW